MSEQEDFENLQEAFESWESKQPREYFWQPINKEIALAAWTDGNRQKAAEIEKQAAEIEALKIMLNEIVDCDLITDDQAYNLGLIDKNGNPTPLLTGVKDE